MGSDAAHPLLTYTRDSHQVHVCMTTRCILDAWNFFPFSPLEIRKKKSVQTLSTVPPCVHAMDGFHVSSQHYPTTHGGGRKAVGTGGNRSRMRTCEEIF